MASVQPLPADNDTDNDSISTVFSPMSLEVLTRLGKDITLERILIQERGIILSDMQRDGRVRVVDSGEVFEHKCDMMEVVHIRGPPDPSRLEKIANHREDWPRNIQGPIEERLEELLPPSLRI